MKQWTSDTDEGGFQCCHRRRRRAAAIACEAPCGATIEPGDTYVATAQCYDGRWSRFEMHEGCWQELMRQADTSFGFIADMEETAEDDAMRFNPATKTWEEL